MLILTRKNSETIRIGDDVFITLVEAGHRRVKIGVQAPAGVRILRGELGPYDPPATEQGPSDERNGS